MLYKISRDAHVFKYLHTSSLISLKKLCDDEYTAILNKKLIRVFKGKNLVLLVKRNQIYGLWYIPLTFPVSLFLPIQ